MGAGLSFGGGDGGQDSGPEGEQQSEEQSAPRQQETWPPDRDSEQYDAYDTPYGYPPEYYGIWTMSRDEPKEEDWTVVSRSKGKCNVKCCNRYGKMIGSMEQDEHEEIKVDAVMDSGAFDTVCPMELVGGNKIRQTEASKAGMDYYACNGDPIRNKGAVDIAAVGEDGQPIKFTAQVGEGVKKLLVSLRKVAEDGNMIILGANLQAIKRLAKLNKIEENLVMNTKTGAKSEIKKKNAMYVYPITIKRKKKDVSGMDIGTVGRFEH